MPRLTDFHHQQQSVPVQRGSDAGHPLRVHSQGTTWRQPQPHDRPCPSGLTKEAGGQAHAKLRRRQGWSGQSCHPTNTNCHQSPTTLSMVQAIAVGVLACHNSMSMYHRCMVRAQAMGHWVGCTRTQRGVEELE
jgi:hypothetical protein